MPSRPISLFFCVVRIPRVKVRQGKGQQLWVGEARSQCGAGDLRSDIVHRPPRPSLGDVVHTPRLELTEALAVLPQQSLRSAPEGDPVPPSQGWWR